MEDTISISNLKALVEHKIRKKVMLKVMWNDNEKLTLLITPNININSFIYDEKDGYIFYDQEGNQINREVPCILSDDMFRDGEVILKDPFTINGSKLTKEDRKFLEENNKG